MRLKCSFCKQTASVNPYFDKIVIRTTPDVFHNELEYEASATAAWICPCCGANVSTPRYVKIYNEDIIKLSFKKELEEN